MKRAGMNLPRRKGLLVAVNFGYDYGTGSTESARTGGLQLAVEQLDFIFYLTDIFLEILDTALHIAEE